MYTISASKLKEFTTCRKQYYETYILKKKDQKPRHPAAALGTAVHKAIEQYYRASEEPFRTFHAAWNQELATYPELNDTYAINKFVRDGMDMLSTYDFAGRPVPDEVEVSFTEEYTPEVTFHGYIDQLYTDRGIVDLKSGRNRPNQGVLNYDLQFILYSWVYEKKFNHKPNVVWYHLRTGDDIVAHVSDKYGYLEDKVGQFVDAHKAFERTQDPEIFERNVGFSCSFCAYRVECLGA